MPNRKYQYVAAPPQTGEIHLDVWGFDKPKQYGVEQFIIDLRSPFTPKRANLEEWLGRLEPPRIPANHAMCSNPACAHGRILPLSAFYEDDRKTNGRYSMCKACHSASVKRSRLLRRAA